MRLYATLLLILKVALAQTTLEVIGFVGQSVTLPSRADVTLSYSFIEWSIFTNKTFLATFRNGNKNIVDLYKSRLRFNTTTGNLEILNLSQADAMEYTVSFKTASLRTTNKILLRVHKPLKKPTIKMHSFSPDLWVMLLCSSENEGVSYSWQMTPSSSSLQSPNNSQVFATILNSTVGHVEFTCTCSRGRQTVSTTVPLVADGTLLLKSERLPRICIVSVCFGLALTAVFLIIYGKRNPKVALWPKGNVSVIGVEPQGSPPLNPS